MSKIKKIKRLEDKEKEKMIKELIKRTGEDEKIVRQIVDDFLSLDIKEIIEITMEELERSIR